MEDVRNCSCRHDPSCRLSVKTQTISFKNQSLPLASQTNTVNEPSTNSSFPISSTSNLLNIMEQSCSIISSQIEIAIPHNPDLKVPQVSTNFLKAQPEGDFKF